ncbi:MAG: hypothetical protein KO206_04930 [Methanomicrobiaceae archaeon]|uniref:Uncharacterized protein n=1 Tax=hydrocarbon metagenome TaxID=938273 RepID=A0A0W8FHR6_9ZZZZ|nr:hypothetical protein [Methanomicrobiaceae archaeon]MDD5418589.1 hypothetical protein [Methanomicrobiaceae archaeon]
MANRTDAKEEASFPLELQQSGIVLGASVDIRDLQMIQDRFNITVFLYFEENLARESTLGDDLRTYGDIPEFERPFIRVDVFLEYATGSDPAFLDRLNELPLEIEIIAYGELQQENENPLRYVKGIMPFLDELIMDDVPTAY